MIICEHRRVCETRGLECHMTSCYSLQRTSMTIASVCTHRISVSTLKLFVVLSWMLEDAEHTTIGSYGVSGIVWYGTICKNYVEHACC